jgi:hypothetical protein
LQIFQELATMDDAKTFKTDAIHEENPAIQDRTVIAIFADAGTADRAREALEAAGYKHVDVTSADSADAGKPVHEHGFWEGLKAIFGGHRDAPVYGEAIRNGNSLVTLHTEQGRAAYAIEILDSFAPIDLKGGEQAWIPADQLNETSRAETLSAAGPTTAGNEGSVIEEDLLIVEVDPDLGNDRVRSYARNLPVVVANQDRGIAEVATLEGPTADAVKRAD